MTRFFILWFGQVISMIGSGITAFGISVWVYQNTSSVTLFAINGLIKFLPSVLLAPLAGLLADLTDDPDGDQQDRRPGGGLGY